MRYSTIVSALFAVGALSSPVNPKRDLVTDVVVITVTDIVYEGETPSTLPVANFHSTSTTAEVVAFSSSTSTPVVVVIPTSTAAPIIPTTSAAPPVSSAPATSSTPAASPASGGAPTTLVPGLDVSSPTYAAIALEHHNVHRSNHSAQAVTYNETLATWAQAKASSCVWDESLPAGASGVGMNIAQGTYLGAGNLSAVISNLWYDSEILNFPAYGVNNLDTSGAAFQGWGHFSQVVWSDTESIGCGSSPCGGDTSIGSGYFVACLYYPPGNFLGEFTKVGKPLGNPTVEVVGDTIVGL